MTLQVDCTPFDFDWSITWILGIWTTKSENATASLRLQECSFFLTLCCNKSWKCLLWVLFAQTTLTTVLHFGKASPSLLLATIHQRSPSRIIDKKSVYNTGGYPERKANGPWKSLWTKNMWKLTASFSTWGVHLVDAQKCEHYFPIGEVSDGTRGTWKISRKKTWAQVNRMSVEFHHLHVSLSLEGWQGPTLIACFLVANL